MNTAPMAHQEKIEEECLHTDIMVINNKCMCKICKKEINIIDNFFDNSSLDKLQESCNYIIDYIENTKLLLSTEDNNNKLEELKNYFGISKKLKEFPYIVSDILNSKNKNDNYLKSAMLSSGSSAPFSDGYNIPGFFDMFKK